MFQENHLGQVSISKAKSDETGIWVKNTSYWTLSANRIPCFLNGNSLTFSHQVIGDKGPHVKEKPNAITTWESHPEDCLQNFTRKVALCLMGRAQTVLRWCGEIISWSPYKLTKSFLHLAGQNDPDPSMSYTQSGYFRLRWMSPRLHISKKVESLHFKLMGPIV